MSPGHLTWGLLPPAELDLQVSQQYFYGYNRVPELIALTLLAVYLLIYIVGTHRNASIAAQIRGTIDPLLQLQFSSVDNTIKLNQNQYLLHCSGRTNIHSMLCTIQLQSRYDLLSILVQLGVGNITRDSILIDWSIESDVMDKYVVCVAKRKISRQYKKQNNDLNHLATIQINDFKQLNNQFVILTDSNDATKQLLDTDTLAFIDRYGAFIEYLHISDSCEIEHDSTSKTVLRYRMILPNQYDELLVVITALLRMIDRLPSIRLPIINRNKAIEQRDIYARMLSKQQSNKKDSTTQPLNTPQSDKKQSRRKPRTIR